SVIDEAEVSAVRVDVVDSRREAPGAIALFFGGEPREVVPVFPRLDDHRPIVEPEVDVKIAAEECPPRDVDPHPADAHERTIARVTALDDDVLDLENPGRDARRNAADMQRT